MVRRALRTFVVSALLLLTALPSLASPAGADTPPRKIVTGWVPYWATSTATSTVTANADLMSEVSPFWFSLKSASRALDQYSQSNSTPMAVQTNALRAAGVQVIPTITDGTGKLVLAGILADPVKSATLIATLTTLVLANNFDGIDLDWEGFAFVDGTSTWSSTQPNWTAFVKQLSVSLHAQGKLLSVTTPELRDPTTGKRGYWVYDWAGIGSSIDRLRIMTYDYSVSSAGPIGPITWVEAAAKYAASLIPASKIWIGVPAYGRDWVVSLTGVCPVGVDIKAPANGTAGSRAAFVVKDAQALAASYGATATWNATYGENTFNYSKVYSGAGVTGATTSCTAQRTVWYQDPRGVQLRAALVGKYRLGGIAFWSFGSEDPATWDLLRSYAKTIAPDKVIADLAVAQDSVTYSSMAQLTASFHILDSTPVVGIPITFQALRAGETDWRDIGAAATSATGVAQIALVMSGNLQVRAVSQGSWERLGATSPSQAVRVSRIFSIQPPISVRRASQLAVTGTVWPAEAGVGVILQERSFGNWRDASQVTTSDGGNYSFTYPVRDPGLALYRVAVKPDLKFVGVTGTPFTVLVR